MFYHHCIILADTDIPSNIFMDTNLNAKRLKELRLNFFEKAQRLDNYLTTLEEENKQLKSEMEEVKEEVEQLKTEIEKLIEEKKQLKTENEALHVQLRSLGVAGNEITKNELVQYSVQLEHGLNDE
jgi:peptidoglycan hydrolase CwlO-like protein